MEEEEIQPLMYVASESEQFSWTAQGMIEASIEASNALSDGNGTRSF